MTIPITSFIVFLINHTNKGKIMDTAQLPNYVDIINDKTLYQGKTRQEWINAKQLTPSNKMSMDILMRLMKIGNKNGYKNYGIEKNGCYYPPDYKTYISHPTHDGIEPLVKHLNYDLPNFANKLFAQNSKENFVKFILDFNKLQSDIDMYYFLCKINYLQSSCHYQIRQEVSKDALFCKNEGITTTRDIPWERVFPRNIIEFFFEDPNLPTFLAYRGSFSSLVKKMGIPCKNLGTEDDHAIHFFAETPSLGTTFFTIDNENLSSLLSQNYDELLAHHNAPAIGDFNFGAKTTSNFTKQEIPHLVSAVITCVKCLIYADCDPLHIESNVPMSSLKDGKPNVKGRPKGEIHRIVYVPKVRYANDKSSCGSDQTRRFLGRLPYTRTYKAKCFVNVRGKTLHYPKVLGANGEDPVEREYSTYIARKIKTPFSN